MKLDILINKFVAATLPKEDWTHLAHLRVALYYAFTEENEYKAICQVKCGIIIYASRLDPFYGCHYRYHETKTVFWVKQIKLFITQNSNKDIYELDELLLKSDLIRSEYIEQFYSKELLDSDLARAIYVDSKKF